MNIEFAGVDWLMRGWLMILAFTAAVLVVAALRKPCRRLFGTERAFQLWLLPPLTLLASQLPHAADVGNRALPSLVYVITSASDVLSSRTGALPGIDWRLGIVSIWCAGTAVFLLLAVVAQWRYRRRLLDATPVSESPSRFPVLRATSADVGPALVGAWRIRIVLPADFDHRYDATERALILAHEAMHARRRDGLWCLLAQPVVALFWFHPLAWWALSALRHDQELACDAAVLREHGAQRRSYAHAMLKTQSALFALPVGCPWSPRHPLTERIAMLKLPLPGRLRDGAGKIAGLVLVVAVAGSAYAASAPADRHAAATGANEYQLDMNVELGTDDTRAEHVERMTLALCMAPGKSGTVSSHGWKVDATPTPEGKDLRIDLAVAATDGAPLAQTRLHGALGESLHAEGKGADGLHRYAIDVTPRAGCPARMAAADTGARLRLVSQAAKNEPARALALSVAAKSGLTLIHPELLDNRPVTLNFDQIPAERAMQLIADIDGMKPVFEGSRVHFEQK
jgi:beta-lactamase regulating signal transducer with metallopeptidase domain